MLKTILVRLIHTLAKIPVYENATKFFYAIIFSSSRAEITNRIHLGILGT